MLKNYYQDLNIVRVNTMPNRAYYIPCSNSKLNENKQDNDRILMLNGEWNFKYYESVSDFKFDADNFDKINVPSNWQMLGYDKNQYTNTRYAIPYNPPYVPKKNPCGLYEKSFSIHKNDDMRYFINLEGADSCHYIYINNEFVGYSQVSHLTSEYEITDFIKDGCNKINVVVLKWCDGTYVEDQDKLRMSGIFRDIFILTRPKQFVYDYKIKTTISDDNNATAILIMDDNHSNIKKTIKILDANNELISSIETDSKSVSFDINSPILWNAENPYLYKIIIATENETIIDHFGIRTVCIKDKVVLINGKPVKFKGVNRHDSYADTGYVSSIKQLTNDLKTMKEHNVNAIRTSHYPNRPEFYKLCDKYGFYVIDESDIESHGTVNRTGKWSNDLFADIADNKDWELTIVDRCERMVARDKNRPSVIIWSLGNESGFGQCFKAANKRVREMDSTRLVHYESIDIQDDFRLTNCESNTGDKNISDYFEDIDFVSRMYPSISWINDKFLANEKESKPLILCEFSHAMGNGPGDLREYYDLIYKNDNFCGAFVWEWCDHTVKIGEKDSKAMYAYGGDFGEFPHDGNFCMDGLVYPDRRPHTGLKELKNAARPAHIIFENNEYYIENKLNFTNLNDYLYVSYTIKEDGNLIKSGIIEDINVLPAQKKKLDILDIPQINSSRVYILFELRLKNSTNLLPSGHILGHEQFDISTVQYTENINKKGNKINIEDSSNHIALSGENFIYMFNKEFGSFDFIQKNGNIITEKPIDYNFYRAPIDNDMHICKEWKSDGFDRTIPYTYDITVNDIDDGIQIVCPLSIGAIYLENIAEINAVWTVFNSGNITVKLDTKIAENKSFLPRFGLRLFLNDSFNECEYFGYGPNESYIDKNLSCYVDKFTSKIENMFEDYIKPQENSSHCNTEYVKLTSENSSLMAVSDNKFSFNVSEYTQEELASKAHNYELNKCDYKVLCLDYKMSGVGSNSCGPELLEKYRLDKKKFVYEISLIIE